MRCTQSRVAFTRQEDPDTTYDITTWTNRGHDSEWRHQNKGR